MKIAIGKSCLKLPGAIYACCALRDRGHEVIIVESDFLLSELGGGGFKVVIADDLKQLSAIAFLDYNFCWLNSLCLTQKDVPKNIIGFFRWPDLLMAINNIDWQNENNKKQCRTG